MAKCQMPLIFFAEPLEESVLEIRHVSFNVSNPLNWLRSVRLSLTMSHSAK